MKSGYFLNIVDLEYNVVKEIKAHGVVYTDSGISEVDILMLVLLLYYT